MKSELIKIVFCLLVLLAASVSPNLFVVSQAGYALLSSLAIYFLIPSIAVIAIIYGLSYGLGLQDIRRQIQNGIIAGWMSTAGLEIVREIGFHLGGMPGDMPKLLGVLLLNRFALGPNALSNLAGWSYHFWNGAAFGIIYSILAGKGRIWMGIIYALLIATGFMMSPAVVAMGVGHFGINFGWGFPLTVILAHLAFGSLLGWVIYRLNEKDQSLFTRVKRVFR
jgi:hypothetical protein